MKRRDFLKNALAVAIPAVGCGWVLGRTPRTLTTASSSSAHNPPVRPPGALNEAEFLSRCIRCLRCVEACPNSAIVPLDESFGPQLVATPAIQPRRQACMLCNKMDGDHLRCTEICPSGALELVRKNPEEILRKVSMGKAELDQKLCYSYNNWSCGACYRACPFPGKAMTIGLWERPEVITEGCVGCGLCERSCIRYPHAIRVKTSRV